MTETRTLVLIPARMAATRLPGKPLLDIAGVLAYDGRVLGLMPHPERALFTTQLPHFPYLQDQSRRAGKKLPARNASQARLAMAGGPTRGPGFQIFQNAINYFS